MSYFIIRSEDSEDDTKNEITQKKSSRTRVSCLSYKYNSEQEKDGEEESIIEILSSL